MKRPSAGLQDKIISQSLALFLCFWMSGIICAVLCYPAGVKGLVEQQQQQATSGSTKKTLSCPMHKQTAERAPETSETAADLFVAQHQNAPRFKCCSPAGFFLAAQHKVNQTDAPVFAAAVLNKFDFVVAFNLSKLSSPVNYQIAPQPRGDTYLQNCVFLI